MLRRGRGTRPRNVVSGRSILSRTVSIAAAGLVLFVFDRTILRAGTAALDALGHVALWGAHTAVAAAIGILGIAWAALHGLAGRLRKAKDGRAPAWIAGLLLAIAIAPAMYVVAAALVAGDWIAKQKFARAIEAGVAIGGVIGFFVLGWLFARTSPARAEGAPEAVAPSRWRSFIFPAILLVGASGAAALDALVLPGLYPALHLFLYGASALLLVMAAARFTDRLVPEARSKIVGIAGGGALVIAIVLGAIFVPGKRAPLSVGSRTAGLVLPYVTAPSRVVAEELGAMDLRADAAKKKADSTAAVTELLSGRRDYNVLLIIVDTLRADTLPPARGEGRPFAKDEDTPFLNEWLSKAYRFKRAYSQASRTRRSLPPTFRGVEANEDTERVGTALGTQASALGLVPAAVVPQYFLLPESESAQHLLIGFDRATFYEKDHQEVILDRVHDTFEGLKGQRFFAWVHFYNMHDPYFADRLMSGGDGSVAVRYQKALRWLDAQMKRLLGELESSGLAGDTVVIFTADHGENVGLEGGRTGHGGTVDEAEVRVPLAVRIPGKTGREIATVAGNVDIVPTVFDLVGAPPRPSHRGRSLLPILAGVEEESLPLYFENSSGEVHGLAIGEQKLVHAGKANLFHRYDLASDPTEKRDLYDPSGEPDRALRRAMLRKNPSLFASELTDPKIRSQLVARLGEVGPAAQAGPSLELLLRLAALSKDPAALAQGQRIFRDARDIDVQLLAIDSLFDTDPPAWTALLAERLKKLAGTPEEPRLVEGLANSGQPAFAIDLLAARLAELSFEPSEGWAPYLALVRDWKKPQTFFVEPLELLVSAFPSGPRTPAQSRALLLLMESCGTLVAPLDAPGAKVLAAAVRPFVEDPDPKVAVAATRALGKLKDAEAPPLLRAMLDSASLDVRIRQAILHALTDVEGRGATALVADQGGNPLLTVDACQILAQLKDPAALPFLRNVAQTHYNGYTREEAKKAIKAIEAASRGPSAPSASGSAAAPKDKPPLRLPKPRKP